ncbi:hypothetical protein [Rubinisphaera margarita]|uniref:hypothetical protein n=1 Tax=Rubinisphaera margarita TaxID=2909586 RepID=UPI001EE8298B|nr:hypothetical protein [Rubinisphaera margarita]MCG6158323.1 hypothetical protein [Rubinisphaera margarita]
MFQNLPESAHPLVMSYIGVRRAIGISGLMLPILLGPIGWLIFGIELQDNMSSYYHTPLRDIFVGTLCGIGIFLFCYQGHDWVENWTANLGCLFALGLALFPIDVGSDPLHPRTMIGFVHSVSGGGFFLVFAFYSLYHFPISSSDNLELEPHEQQRNFVYRASGISILLSMIAMGGYLFVIPLDWKTFLDQFNVLFWLEWVAIWSFAAAWLTKGRVILADVAIDLLALTQEQLMALARDRKESEE